MRVPLRVLLIIQKCNPLIPSVHLEGYRYFSEVSKLSDVTLVTHERNKDALEQAGHSTNIIYVTESRSASEYYRLVGSITIRRNTNWPLLRALSYPIYAEFDHRVFQKMAQSVLAGKFDVVHAFTPIVPRYPYKIVNACETTPFILGPVNGGLPYPGGFAQVEWRESRYLNFLRSMTRFLPGYIKTYQSADKVLAGSTFTLSLVKNMLKLQEGKLELFYENGVSKSFFNVPSRSAGTGLLNLLFVGRLVPYKGADILLDALSRLDTFIKQHMHLTIVGDGPERVNLEAQAQELGVESRVTFAGWVQQEDTVDFYREADIFCFPSIREFGGAVVLEAMACGLPCIVADYGGIGEYVTDETGFRVELSSREALTAGFAEKVQTLFDDGALRQKMSAAAVERASDFEWQRKATDLIRIYEETIVAKERQQSHSPG